MAAFPGATNQDVSTGPWHSDFGGTFGTLSVLATSPDASGVVRALIIGGGTGTVIGPSDAIPEPATLLLLGSGLAGLYRSRRKAKARRV